MCGALPPLYTRLSRGPNKIYSYLPLPSAFPSFGGNALTHRGLPGNHSRTPRGISITHHRTDRSAPLHHAAKFNHRLRSGHPGAWTHTPRPHLVPLFFALIYLYDSAYLLSWDHSSPSPFIDYLFLPRICAILMLFLFFFTRGRRLFTCGHPLFWLPHVFVVYLDDLYYHPSSLCVASLRPEHMTQPTFERESYALASEKFEIPANYAFVWRHPHKPETPFIPPKPMPAEQSGLIHSKPYQSRLSPTLNPRHPTRPFFRINPSQVRIRADKMKQCHIKIEEESYWTNGITTFCFRES